jgi:class 3 adenylate cyclase
MDDALTARLDAMAKASDLAPAAIADLGHWVRTADDAELYRFNPLLWAKARGMEEDAALDLLMHATKVGILEMSWGVICPYCGMLITTPGGLRALGPNPHCRVCRVDVAGALDDRVEVVFSVAPGIRNLRFFDPNRVDIKRDGQRLFFSPSLKPTPAYEQIEAKIRSWFIADFAIAPGESATIEVDASQPGMYAAIAPTVHALCYLSTEEGGDTRLELDCLDGQFIPDSVLVAPGKLSITVRNLSDYHLPGGVMYLGPTHPTADVSLEMLGAPVYEFHPFLTGKRMLTNQTFRDLFRAETIGPGGLHIKNLAIVFSDLQASTALYERVGDLRALRLVRDHFDLLHDVVSRHRGSIVKTIGDAVMAAFGEPERALAAAAGMSRAVSRINADGEHLVLKIGLHAGSCIAIQTNHQIDYFGRAVNIAARVQSVANGGEIVVTDTVWQSPAIPGLAMDYGLRERPDTVRLRGIAEEVAVHRLS